MSITNKCDLCLTEWDAQVQVHKRGQDCVAGLKGLIDSLYGYIKRLERMYSDHADCENQKEDATVNSFREVRDLVAALEKRHETLAKRVNILEHPKLANVPSMPANPGKKT